MSICEGFAYIESFLSDLDGKLIKGTNSNRGHGIYYNNILVINNLNSSLKCV